MWLIKNAVECVLLGGLNWKTCIIRTHIVLKPSNSLWDWMFAWIIFKSLIFYEQFIFPDFIYFLKLLYKNSQIHIYYIFNYCEMPQQNWKSSTYR